jgi:hypothetical protein
MLKAISYAKVKTDSVDARTLAELLRVGLIPEAHQCRRDQRDLRELTRGRLRMIERRSSLQSSLWQLAAKYNVIVQDVGWRYLDKLGEFFKVTTATGRMDGSEAFTGSNPVEPGSHHST